MATKTESSKMWAKVGVWSYIAGIVIAAILGIIATFGDNNGIDTWAVIVLAVLGVIVGLLNIGDDEVQMFLLASLAFVISSLAMGNVFAALGANWQGLQTFMNAITIFTAPGALVVAFKALYNVAHND